MQDEYEFIVNVRNLEVIQDLYTDFRFQNINNQWAIAYVPRTEIRFLRYDENEYYAIPKLYGLMDQKSLAESGILPVQNRNNLNLSGKGVIIGFVDTGIDYRHSAFLDVNGQTRIVALWDQTMDGTTPSEYGYGTVYSSDEINQALMADGAAMIVPQKDEDNGHGTFLAGVAAGSREVSGQYIGAAPEASIAVVKLRRAPTYLYEFYQVDEECIAYSENDIMLGVRYLLDVANREKKPLVICLGLGSSYGPHNSESPLMQYLNQVAQLPRVAIVTAMGNEGNGRGHVRGMVEAGEKDDVEIQVGNRIDGFMLEMWSQYPGIFSIRLRTPSGERSERIGFGRVGHQEVRFVYEDTRIVADYNWVETLSGNAYIALRFIKPAKGVWSVEITNEYGQRSEYNMWLPITDFVRGELFFLDSTPVMTLTQPASASGVISVAAYDYRTGGIWLDSSRGYAVGGVVKPDIAAPGVLIAGPIPGVMGANDNEYRMRSGTSIAAAHVAGAAALLMEWRVRENTSSETIINTSDIRALLILGATRSLDIEYPNMVWGYGKLNLANTFDILAGIVI